MRKKVFGRRFKRTVNQRKALFKSLVQSLVLNGSIKTTEAKAKAIKGEVEKMVTYAKNKPENALQHLSKSVSEKTANIIIQNVAPVFKDRPGGYTRIIRVGNRVKDNAPMVMLSWVDTVTITKEEERKVVKKEAEAQVKTKTVKKPARKKTTK